MRDVRRCQGRGSLCGPPRVPARRSLSWRTWNVRGRSKDWSSRRPQGRRSLSGRCVPATGSACPPRGRGRSFSWPGARPRQVCCRNWGGCGRTARPTAPPRLRRLKRTCLTGRALLTSSPHALPGLRRTAKSLRTAAVSAMGRWAPAFQGRAAAARTAPKTCRPPIRPAGARRRRRRNLGAGRTAGRDSGKFYRKPLNSYQRSRRWNTRLCGVRLPAVQRWCSTARVWAADPASCAASYRQGPRPLRTDRPVPW
ncbi:hypothetical protein SALB_07515 [Streptomyces noursei]|uniref:Uncharacterized protein n=1 Tax=Streptomyces noursei TaxID=1971 RepID=A0A401RAT4_STRNR|nr:hypothetical protein SALB_07515 [Streptomyces noursei]